MQISGGTASARSDTPDSLPRTVLPLASRSCRASRRRLCARATRADEEPPTSRLFMPLSAQRNLQSGLCATCEVVGAGWVRCTGVPCLDGRARRSTGSATSCSRVAAVPRTGLVLPGDNTAPDHAHVQDVTPQVSVTDDGLMRVPIGLALDVAAAAAHRRPLRLGSVSFNISASVSNRFASGCAIQYSWAPSRAATTA